jgi:xylulokinase
MRVVAGVDSSTQSTTVLLRDAETGAALSVGRSAHTPTFPPVSEQHPSEWWSALIEAFAEARRIASVVPADIVAISVAAQCHGLVALDATGEVVRPAKLWNDTTSSAQAAALTERFGADELVTRLGSLPTAAFTISKVAWLAENEPENFARTASVLLPHDWLTFRLTGRRVTDRSDASGTGYYNSRGNCYDTELLNAVDTRKDWLSMLPVVLGPAEVAGIILPEAAAALGVSTSAIIGAGAGDQHAGAIGLGARPGDLVWVLGTSGVVYGISESPVVDLTGMVDCVSDATGNYQPLICTLNSTKVTDAIGRLLGATHDELAALALAADRSVTRPVFVPYLDGERTPNLPHARGVISGLDSGLSREQFALAAFEGVVLGLLRGHQALLDLGVAASGRLVVIGGGSKSAAYLQVIADFTGREVHTTDAAEAVAAGAGVQAAAALGGVTIQQVRDAWAPGFALAASPQSDVAGAVIMGRYIAAAGFAAAEGSADR